MAAAVLGEPGQLLLKHRPVPAVEAPDDVIVRVEACGICGSDLQMLSNPPAHPARTGVILGHEMSGYVVAHGSAVEPPAGLVVIDPDIKCGECEACRRGRPSTCRRMVALGVDADGGFAAYCRVPARNVYQIKGHVSPSTAALVEPLAAVQNGIRRLHPELGETAVLFGAGPIGCLFLLSLRASGVTTVWAIDPVPARRQEALRLGASGAAADVTELDDAVDSGALAPPDLVIDAVGRCLRDAITVVGDGGRILLFGINDRARAEVRQFDITSREITVVGALTSRYTFPTAVAMAETMTSELERLRPIDVGLPGMHDALELLRRGEALKAIVRPQW
jgi:threonine dehydrogenase-like Zn-dependent dehydrogenase